MGNKEEMMPIVFIVAGCFLTFAAIVYLAICGA